MHSDDEKPVIKKWVYNLFLNQCILFYCHTVPSAVKYLNSSRGSESITVTWPPAQSMFDGYVLSINSKVFSEKKTLPSDVRYDDYILKITDMNAKQLFPMIFKISTLCCYLYVVCIWWFSWYTLLCPCILRTAFCY